MCYVGIAISSLHRGTTQRAALLTARCWARRRFFSKSARACNPARARRRDVTQRRESAARFPRIQLCQRPRRPRFFSAGAKGNSRCTPCQPALAYVHTTKHSGCVCVCVCVRYRSVNPSVPASCVVSHTLSQKRRPYEARSIRSDRRRSSAYGTVLRGTSREEVSGPPVENSRPFPTAGLAGRHLTSADVLG